MNAKFKSLKENKGFTLVEMIVSVGLFLAVVTISSGAVLSAIDANRKAEQLRIAMDNLSLMAEDMTREIRVGSNYDCGPAGAPTDCSAGGSELRFISPYNGAVRYYFANGRIYKNWNIGTGNEKDSAISDIHIDISDLNFYVDGTEDSPNTVQPYVLMQIKGEISTGKIKTPIDFQTLMSQR